MNGHGAQVVRGRGVSDGCAFLGVVGFVFWVVAWDVLENEAAKCSSFLGMFPLILTVLSRDYSTPYYSPY